MKRICIIIISISFTLPLTGQIDPPLNNGSAQDSISFQKMSRLITAYESRDYETAVTLYRQTFQNLNAVGHNFLIAASKSYMKLYELNQVDSLKMMSQKIWNQGVLRYGEDFMNNGYDEEVYLIVEETAKPDKGLEKHKKSLYLELEYPKTALENKIEGTVFLEFLVTKEGNAEGINVIKGLSEECNNAAIKLINNSTWNPAKQRGIEVNSMNRWRVEFSIKKYEWGLKKYGQ